MDVVQDAALHDRAVPESMEFTRAPALAGPATTVICVTPVKNEGWIIREFLTAASAWADVVLVGDNGSDDETVAIASTFKKVTIVDLGTSFDEFERRRALLDRARLIPGRRFVIGLDADEMLSATWATGTEWHHILAQPEGTRFVFDWVEILPGRRDAVAQPMLFAYIDDGSTYVAPPIHSPRVPPEPAKVRVVEEIKVLHLACIDQGRELAKHRFYKCIELVQHHIHPIDACIRYQVDAISTYAAPIILIPPAWTEGLPIPVCSLAGNSAASSSYWFDRAVLDMFDEHGAYRFRRLNIWDHDWAMVASALGRPPVQDPRSMSDRAIHAYVKRNRTALKHPRNRRERFVRRALRFGLRPFGW